ncbi:MAG: hypothetical protein ACLT2T_04205 [Bilophila wadsworthia]
MPISSTACPSAWIQSSVARLRRAARAGRPRLLSADVETVAHLKAACRLVPDATYVIDIGGQDMKCSARDSLIAGVTSTKPAPPGGAFLETFARPQLPEHGGVRPVRPASRGSGIAVCS